MSTLSVYVAVVRDRICFTRLPSKPHSPSPKQFQAVPTALIPLSHHSRFRVKQCQSTRKLDNLKPFSPSSKQFQALPTALIPLSHHSRFRVKQCQSTRKLDNLKPLSPSSKQFQALPTALIPLSHHSRFLVKQFQSTRKLDNLNTFPQNGRDRRLHPCKPNCLNFLTLWFRKG
jgi:transposase-like protein